MPDTVYHQIFSDAFTKNVNFGSGGDAFKLALFSSSKVVEPDDVAYSTTNEIPTAGGYTQGGYAYSNANQSISDDDVNNRMIFDINEDASWANSTITARYAQLYDAGYSNHLVCLFDFGADKSSTAGTFKVVFNATGIMTIT